MPTTDSAKLYGHWLGMWNGDLSYAREIVTPECVIHHPVFRGATSQTRTGIEGVTAVVEEARAPFQRLMFTLDIGPIEEGDKLAARWTARGSYAGGLPGANAAPGAPVAFSGIDFFRITQGRIAECWVSTDAVQVLQQVGAISEPE